jgi:tetratricopeptide (TPR) repeat protein
MYIGFLLSCFGSRLIRRVTALVGVVAISVLTAWSQTSRVDPEVVKHMRAGLQARKEQRWSDSAREFEAAARLAPNLAEAYANLGLVRSRQGDNAAAAAAFEKALELRPNLPGLRGFLGFSYLMLSRAGQAVTELEKALQETPSNPQLEAWLGLAYLESNRYRDAIPKLETASAARPEHIDTLLYLAKAYEGALGEVHDELYRLDRPRARELEPLVKSQTAEGQAGSGDPARIAQLEAARKSDAGDVEILGELAVAYKQALDGVRAQIFKIDTAVAAEAFGGAGAKSAASGAAAGPEREAPLSIGQRETLVRQACAQCHRFPPPNILPKRAWVGKVEKMFSLANVALLPTFNRPIRELSMAEAAAYFETLAPEELDTPPWGPAQPHAKVSFEKRSLVAAGEGEAPPGSGDVQLMELFDDVPGLELVVCDMFSGWVSWADPDDAKTGLTALARLAAPDHAEMVDLDGDGLMDLLVAELGQVIPSDKKLGAVTWLRQIPGHNFEVIRIARNLGRVADAQAADFDGDGDLDVVAAVFGWITVGRIVYLENQAEQNGGQPTFVPRTLDDRIGSLNVPIVDFNKDGKPDILALISQQHETIVAFLGRGDGQFDRKEVFTAEHPHWGFSRMQTIDFDGDDDLDVLYTNGDTMDDMIRFKPFQGVAWLENRGEYPFVHHLISRHYGAIRAEAGDLDGDGDMDVATSVWLPELSEEERQRYNLPGVSWYEQTEGGSFIPHVISETGCDRPTLTIGDIDGDGKLDVVTGTAWLGAPPDGVEPVAVDLWRQVRKE